MDPAKEEALLAEWKKATKAVEDAVELVKNLKDNKASKEEIGQAVQQMKNAREAATKLVCIFICTNII